MAAVHLRRDAHAPASVQNPDAFRPINLVSGERQEVDAEFLHVNRNLADRLYGVGVQIEMLLPGLAALLDQRADLFERLDRPDLVVGVHYGDQRGFISQGFTRVFDPHNAFAINGQVGHAPALLFQSPARGQYRRVFDLRGDDMTALIPVGLGDAFDRQVVRLGAARKKSDLGLVGVEQSCDLLPGVLDGLFRLLAVLMRGRGVAVNFGEVGQHGPRDFVIDACGCAVVYINSFNAHIYWSL